MDTQSNKAIMNFNSKGVSAGFLIAFTPGVVAAMSGNPQFPGETTYVDPLKLKYDTFKAAWETARTGTAANKARANALKADVQALLRELCLFVNLTAKGNREMLLTTGFTLNKVRTAVVLSPVRDFDVKYGVNASEFVLSFKKEKGTIGISYQYTTDAVPTVDSKWVAVTESRAKCIIGNFAPGTKVTFRINATAARNQSVYSRMISMIAGYAA